MPGSRSVASSEPRNYEFGPFRFDAVQNLLYRDSNLVPLAPKAPETLHVLLVHHGCVVDRAELLRQIWPDTAVEDVGLARNVSILRKALGEEDADRYIETIPKKGYRFVGEVRVSPPALVDHERGGAAASLRRATGLFRRIRWPVWLALFIAVFAYWQFYVPSRHLGRAEVALAVSSFESLDGDQTSIAFARGLTEIVVAGLSKIGGVHVVSPTTVLRYRRAGFPTSLMARLLGLEVLVEGTAQMVQSRTRVTARLVDVHTGKLIWSESYDFDRSRLAEAQAEAAKLITAQVGAHLSIRARAVP